MCCTTYMRARMRGIFVLFTGSALLRRGYGYCV